MRVVRILHVFKDQKFFDSFSNKYDNIPSFHNLYYFYTSNKNYEFKYIKNKWKIIVIHNRSEYLKLFSSKDIDVILFHSFSVKFYGLFKYINKEKIVIWWSWGGDIYNKSFDILPPLIKHELYKPLTKEYINKQKRAFYFSFSSIRHFAKLFLFPYYKFLQYRSVKRTDYFIPCMSLDYKLLKEQCNFFRAKLFPIARPRFESNFVFHEKAGHVLIGNSLTYTNNHLDIFEKIYQYQLKMGRKYIVPVSYGWGKAFDNNPDNLITRSKLRCNDVVWLRDYLDRDEYFKIFDNVTHAIFGVLRQQALGNIYECLRKGIKVFLYKDSVVADQLKEDGYIFYTIDDDLTESSLAECLPRDEALHNYSLFKLMALNDNIDVVENKLQEIMQNSITSTDLTIK